MILAFGSTAIEVGGIRNGVNGANGFVLLMSYLLAVAGSLAVVCISWFIRDFQTAVRVFAVAAGSLALAWRLSLWWINLEQRKTVRRRP
ncbi:hypothetical protein LNV08_10095 [Paucibacter sp. TC2R-5]|uniref:hypothetical protein n=1 Tax=Paucibacter sp. TC2R-5 TaxID=2893555 RepID=UPI0021E462B6|nr:hypothetical protein [Paucibacter sp. TC2R-5]MCV2359322.1 hypothetical protein [Paucibacter sp. TC2R-5]